MRVSTACASAFPRTLRLPIVATLTAVFTLAAMPVPGAAQAAGGAAAGLSTEMGRFDFGKMWTFEYPPTEYFSETYGFEATPEWFERARMPALRIPGCSASFVSPNGLVVTNHHCARGSISRVSREGENLLDNGFYAPSLDEERPIPGYYADQLIHVEDVTDEVARLAEEAGGGEEARREASARVQARLEEAFRGDQPVWVQMVDLYNGGRQSAYVFRRFTDIRLVVAAELQLGFFGGDPDNFTYPRYALDFTFLRVYENGEPYRPTHWFTWGEGVEEGDAVFVIGNPGPTNRLQTVAQLEYQRDVLVPVRERFFRTRLQALRDAYGADPETGERLGLRNQAFSLSNSLKAYTGRLAALRDPVIMARKASAERDFLTRAAGMGELGAHAAELVDAVAALQAEKRDLQREYGAFYLLGHRTYGSRTLARAMQAARLERAKAAGAPQDTLAAMERALAAVADHPGDLEEDLLRLRLDDLRRHLGEDDPLVQEALGGRSPEGAAAALVARSAFGSRDALLDAVAAGGVTEDDPGARLGAMLLERSAVYGSRAGDIARREAALAASLGSARFAVYGTEMAPDATFSPRITDGVVKGYAFNGTLAPPYTTFYGVYDRYYGHKGAVDWQLPDRWVPPPADLDLATPLNFVSTADTYGGNSGSPAVTKDLAIVGLNFDRNIEGLSRDFIYLPERGRNVMVDVRAIREALDKVYDADRIVLEILTGRLVKTEEEADAGGR